MVRFDKIHNLINDRNFHEALESLQSMSLDGLSTREKAYYDVLLSETAMVAGKPSLVRGLDEATELFRYDRDGTKFARAKYAKGLWLAYRGAYGQAQETLSEAYSNFLRYQDLYGVARSLNGLAYMSHLTGDNESAIDSLERATKTHLSLGNRRAAIGVRDNLFFLCVWMGRLRDGLRQATLIEQEFELLSGPGQTQHQIARAMLHALSGDTDRAKSIVSDTRAGAEENPMHLLDYHQYLGWIFLLSNEYQASKKELSTGLKLARERLPDRKNHTIIRLLAEAYSGLGDYAKAELSVSEALTTASASNERVDIAGCYRILGQLELHRNSRKAARDWFDRALDMYHLIKYRYDLAVTRYLAARSGLYSAEETARMLALAREYFTYENVTHYVEKVDTELGKTSSVKPVITPGPRSDHPFESPDIIVGDPRMRKLITTARQVAPTPMNIIITGDTGTGKDLMAKFIHYHSGRTGRFVSVNSAAIPDSMVESELFGFARGSFSGAERDKPGLFEMAHDGTFFLDEIADTSASFQAKLLEVIESRSVRRLGETKPRSVNYRLIAATNQNLEAQITSGKFRSDLFHRLNQFSIHLPKLSERPEDMRPLVEYFLRTSGLDPTAHPHQIERLSTVLARRHWPGNIRQLRAEIDGLVLMSNRDVRQMVALADKSNRRGEECQKLLDALREANGNKSEAARRLGIHEATFRYRLKKCQDISG